MISPLTLTLASVYYGLLDYDITHLIRDLNHGGALDKLFTYITFTGSTVFMALIIALLLIGGARKEALVFAFIFVATSALALGIKYVIARPRPSDLGVIPEVQASFPSAHVANAFALATIFSGYHRKFTIVMFAWAITIAFSRVFLGLHYFTDVIGGAVLGFVVSYMITRAAGRKDKLISRIAHPVTFIKSLLQANRRNKPCDKTRL
jgi:undecaprenyl-diphosphatase